MRTTVTLDDGLVNALKELAHRSGQSFKDTLECVVRLGLARRRRRTQQPYTMRVFSLGGARPGIDLDKALRLADALEDAEIAKKLELRK